jgi:hypothetical protein
MHDRAALTHAKLPQRALRRSLAGAGCRYRHRAQRNSSIAPHLLEYLALRGHMGSLLDGERSKARVVSKGGECRLSIRVPPSAPAIRESTLENRNRCITLPQYREGCGALIIVQSPERRAVLELDPLQGGARRCLCASQFADRLAPLGRDQNKVNLPDFLPDFVVDPLRLTDCRIPLLRHGPHELTRAGIAAPQCLIPDRAQDIRISDLVS